VTFSDISVHLNCYILCKDNFSVDEITSSRTYKWYAMSVYFVKCCLICCSVAQVVRRLSWV
jgi:hypothetical protein